MSILIGGVNIFPQSANNFMAETLVFLKNGSNKFL